MTHPGIRRTWRILRLAPLPAAGTDWEIKAPGQSWWRITSFAATLVTSAVAGARRATFVADNGTVEWLRQPTVQDQLAGTTLVYTGHTASSRGEAAGIAQTIQLPSAGLLLRPGDRFRPTTTGLLGGDQWGPITAMLEEIPSGPAYQGDQLLLPPEGNPHNLYP